MTVWALLGLAGGILALVDPVPYVRDILRGSTRPHRGTWLIWATLGLVAFAAQVAGGGGWSLVFLGIQAASMTLVVLLSVRRGVGGTSPVELALIGVAAAGMVGWFVLDEPVVATACVVLADAVGVALMLPKAWHDPWSETTSTFALAGGSGLLGAAAIGEAALDLLLYPVYFAVANGVTAAVLVHRKRVLGPLGSLAG